MEKQESKLLQEIIIQNNDSLFKENLHSLGGFGKIELFEYHANLPSSTGKSLIYNAFGKKIAFMSFSPIDGENLTLKALEVSRQIKKEIDLKDSEAILEPIITGTTEGIHFVVWPYLKSISNNKILRYIQLILLKQPIISWLFSVTRYSLTATDAMEKEISFIDPLESFITNKGISVEIRNVGKEIIHKLKNGSFTPYFVIAHNDLWVGNILLQRSKYQKFTIIDWAGANLKGYPIHDLLCIAIMLKLSKRELSRELRNYCNIINCPINHSIFHLVAGLAYLGQNLNNFPEENYLQVVDYLYSYITEVI